TAIGMAPPIATTAAGRAPPETGTTATTAAGATAAEPTNSPSCRSPSRLLARPRGCHSESPNMTETLQSADIQAIQAILPHRYPFLLVDRVIDINGTTGATGIKNVTMNEPHFQGHF